MNSVFQKTRELFDDVNQIGENKANEYKIISDFGKSSILSDPGFGPRTFFRIFTPVKPSKGRKLNSVFGDSFNPYKDSLMDYPTIVQYKLGKAGSTHWENYNRLISVHIARCPLNCWHCFVDDCLKSSCKHCMVQQYCDHKLKSKLEIKEDWISAYDLVDNFVVQRDLDYKRGIHSNILRITGGEPFLAPQLLLDILEELDKRGLQNDIFLWTETNLVPLMVQEKKIPLISDELLNKLGNYDNFLVHPCFHGIDKSSFEENTYEKIENIDLLINALKRLINSGIDVYLTFGSNVNDPDKIDEFYQKMSEINKLLPLRFALIEFDLDYKPVIRRGELIPDFSHRHKMAYDRYQTIENWDDLLRKQMGYGYGEIPRHLVPLINQEPNTAEVDIHFAQKKIENEVPEEEDDEVKKIQDSTGVQSTVSPEFEFEIMGNEKILHFFHWPVYGEYQERMLRIIALPEGAKGEITFDRKWINNDVIDLIASNKEKNKDYYVIFWGLSCEQIKNSNKTKFLFACPIRVLKINNLEESCKSDPTTNNIEFKFIADHFFKQFRKCKTDKLKELLDSGVGYQHPLPCGNEEGLVHVTPRIIDVDDDNFSKTPSLEDLYQILTEIPCSTTHEDAIPISNYPLIFIEEIEEAKIDDLGFYTIEHKRHHNVKFHWHQGERYRNRKLFLRLKKELLKLKGKEGSGEIPLIEKNKESKAIVLEVENSNFDYSIKICEEVHIPHLKQNLPSLLLIIVSVFGIVYLDNQISDWATKLNGILPLTIFIFEAVYNILKTVLNSVET